MKAKYGVIIFVLGLCAILIGSLFKLQHWPYASELLITGTTLEVAGVLSFLYKLLTHPKTRDFFNQ